MVATTSHIPPRYPGHGRNHPAHTPRYPGHGRNHLTHTPSLEPRRNEPSTTKAAPSRGQVDDLPEHTPSQARAAFNHLSTTAPRLRHAWPPSGTHLPVDRGCSQPSALDPRGTSSLVATMRTRPKGNRKPDCNHPHATQGVPPRCSQPFALTPRGAPEPLATMLALTDGNIPMPATTRGYIADHRPLRFDRGVHAHPHFTNARSPHFLHTTSN
jgi:hypothetical protein